MDRRHCLGPGIWHGSNSQSSFQKRLLLPLRSQAPHQPSKMIPGQRKLRDILQGDRKTLYPCVEWQGITKYHPSWSQMCSPRGAHKSGPGGSDQVLQHDYWILRNQTGSTPAHQFLPHSRGRSGPTIPAAPWSQTQGTATWTERIAWWLC